MPTGSASPITVPSLTNGQQYRARVRARNAAGYSDWSAQSAAFTPDRGFRVNRNGPGTYQPMFPNSYREYMASGTVNATDTTAVNAWIAANSEKFALDSPGYSPDPILSEGDIPLVPVALVNNLGELQQMNSDKAWALKLSGVPLPLDGHWIQPSTANDVPAATYEPNYSIFDPNQGRVLARRLWELFHCRTLGATWDMATGRTADKAVTGIGTTINSTSITIPSGAIVQSTDSGMTLVLPAAFPAATYVISVSGTTAVMSNPATATLSGQSGTLTPTDPRLLAWPMFECSNAVRYLDLDQSTNIPSDRYLFNGKTNPDLVEAFTWSCQVTKNSELAGMLLREDVEEYVKNGTVPAHVIDCLTPWQKGTHRWPAQQHDATSRFDASVPMEEGMRFKLDFGFSEAPAASMPLTDAAIEALGLHVIAECVAKCWARYGGMFSDATGTHFQVRWQPSVADFFGGTQYFNVLNSLPINKMKIMNTGSDSNWNP